MNITYHIIKKLQHTALKNYSQKTFSTTSCNNLFWEKDPKGGYNKDSPTYSNWKHVKQGWKELRNELKLFKKEIIEKIEGDPVFFSNPGM